MKTVPIKGSIMLTIWTSFSWRVNRFFALNGFLHVWHSYSFCKMNQYQLVCRNWETISYLHFVNRFNVLLEIRCTREGVVACFTNILFVIVLMDFLDMRIHVGFGGEYFRARWTRKSFIWKRFPWVLSAAELAYIAYLFSCATVGCVGIGESLSGTRSHKFRTRTFHWSAQIPAGVCRTTSSCCRSTGTFCIYTCSPWLPALRVAYHGTFRARRTAGSAERSRRRVCKWTVLCWCASSCVHKYFQLTILDSRHSVRNVPDVSYGV